MKINWVEFIQHCLWAIVYGLAIGLLAYTLGTAFQKALKSKTALILIRLLAFFVVVLGCFVYFPKWFGAN